MLNEENKKQLKEILMKDKKINEEEVDKILNSELIDDNSFNNGIFALLILALMFTNKQPSKVVNVYMGDDK